MRKRIRVKSPHIPIEKSAAVSDCGAKSLIKNCTAELLSLPKCSEQSFDNDSDTMFGDLDSVLTSMIEDEEKSKVIDIALDLPQLEDELEDESDLKDKDKNKTKQKKSKKQRKLLLTLQYQCKMHIGIESFHL